MCYLYDYQKEAVEKLSNGKVLVGGVGTGKSRTALYWYFVKECHGEVDEEFVPMTNTKPLYIITTAKKRDDYEWDKDMAPLLISSEDEFVTVDSWNNIKKYADVKDSIFIFDEQRLVGSGTWVKTFYKIAKNNRWILLTATPGDTFKDYIPVFVANGFYRNKTDFETQHVEWDRFCKFPRYKKFHNTGKLIRFQREILVQMKPPKRTTEQIHIWRKCEYNHDKEYQAIATRWDPYKNEPMQQASVLCYVLRRICNEDSSRLRVVGELIGEHNKVIIFYNFDYELNALRQYLTLNAVEFKEWNGHHHDSLPIGNRWAYLVQYTAGNEGWNCVTCDTIIFYSQNYSYKVMTQAAGRIDRLNTPYQFLNYYHLYSDSKIDTAIRAAVTKKKRLMRKSLNSRLNNHVYTKGGIIMWVISEEKSINLDNVWKICLGKCLFYFNDSSLIFMGKDVATLDCATFENAKEMLKDINQAIYDGKKTFNFDVHLNYIEKRRQNND